MAHGGARPGAGRPKGLRDKPTKKRRKRVPTENAGNRAAAALRSKGIEDIFPGDAHAFLVSVYKNGENEPGFRIDAAKAALPYERPRLTPVAAQQRLPSEMSNDELRAAIADAERKLAAYGVPRGDIEGTGSTKH